MKEQRSPSERLILIVLLAFSAYLLSQQFFGGNKNKGGANPDKPAPPLTQAFKGIDPSQGALFSKNNALAAGAALQKAIDANGADEYSYWARLRAGLIKQYVLGDAKGAKTLYDEVIARNQNKALDAQALYQKGDLAWRQGQQNKTLEEGAYTLEQIFIRSRGDKSFLNHKILVPDRESAAGDPLQLPSRWEEMTLRELRGDLQESGAGGGDPRWILTRVDQYYASTLAFNVLPLYQFFDTIVRWLGARPEYSYGLALIIFALVTRLLMQPLIKKQYDSMKGMSLIAPAMKEIQDKYKGKTDQASQMKMMQEIREVQKQHGVNPMGCGISLIVQMPVFFFVILPIINHYQAHMELADARFLWIDSLARPDIPLLVLYAISMFVSVRLSATPPADEQQRQMQKMMTFMSPMFAFILWTYPSAFILFWMIYNVLSTAFQWRMMKGSDPNKSVVKTLMGTDLSSATTSAATDTQKSNVAIPPRPAKANEGKGTSSKSATTKSAATVPFASENAFDSSLNGASQNGAAQGSDDEEEDSAPQTNGASGNASRSGKSKTGGNARRRRRRH